MQVNTTWLYIQNKQPLVTYLKIIASNVLENNVPDVCMLATITFMFYICIWHFVQPADLQISIMSLNENKSLICE